MTSFPSSRLAVICAAAVAVVGCKPRITIEKLREKNRATIDASVASFVAMEKAVASAPPPLVSHPCSHPGLVPVIPIDFGDPPPPDQRFGPTGEPDTELIDAADLSNRREIPPANGLFEGKGPVKKVVSDARYSKTPLDFKVDPRPAQIPYDAAVKVRYVLVTRTNATRSSAADHADVFLFEHPKGSLVCSFALDAGADRKLAEDHGYDPHTGEPKKDDVHAKPDDLKRLFAEAIQDRFGITYPTRERFERRFLDDPRVRARAAAVSRALDAAPADLRECSAAERAGGARLNKKALRIISGEPLLPRRDPTVQIDPSNSILFVTYLRTRDRSSAEGVAVADSWKVVDVQGGGTAGSIDGKSFVGGYANGRQVVFDAANRAVCQTKFRVAPPKTIDAKTRRTAGGFVLSDVGERSAADLRKRLDEELGP